MSAPAFSPALDTRNVFWLLASMAFVVLPHMLRVPDWVWAFCAAVVLWRAWIAWNGLRFPPRWLIVFITIGASVATLISYGRLVGREAGVTLLLVMAAMKLLEMRTQREVILSIYLGFFLVMTNFLFSQSIPLGLYLLVCVWLFIATLVGFHRVGRTATVRERLAPAGALLVQALPLMAVLFFLFPRVQGPLWALPYDSRTGITGISDSMSPGNLSQLIQSDAVAFRVQFEDAIPPYGLLYFRGPVLWSFDGRTWKMPEPSPAGKLEYPRAQRPVRYAMTLEPHSKNWVFALDVPGTLPRGVSVRHDLRLHSVRPIDQRVRYEMLSYLDYQLGSEITPGQKLAGLRFDETRNPKTVALGRRWAREESDPVRIVNLAFQYFNREFTYTLEPPLLGERDPFDEFLFESKRGFCEHYAGAFALLMRAAGIPSRVVTGYQGGEVNPFNNELIVRQADAHAWVESWIPERGWVRLDPTAAVSPLRVEGGVNAALGPIGILPSLIAADRLGVLASARFAWQYVNSQWDQWIVGYNVERQRQFLSQFGFTGFDWRQLALWMGILAFAVVALLVLWLLARDLPRRGDPAVVAWKRYCGKLARAGLARSPHEGPVDYLARLARERPDLAPSAESITRHYVRARYGPGASRAELRELNRLVRQFRVA